MDKLSYALGLSIGRQLSQMGVAELNADDFAQAVKDMIDGKESQIPTNEAQQLLGEYFRQQEEKQRAEAAEKYKGAKSEGEKYLTENAKKRWCDYPSQWFAIPSASGRQRQKPQGYRTRWCVITRECSWMVPCSIALSSAVTCNIPTKRRYCWLDRRFAADERGC